MNNYLRTKYLGREILYFEEIDSTQKEIWRRIENGNVSQGCLIVAEKQTAGIGTHGRNWYTSPKNITFSFSIFPYCNIKKLENLTYKIAEIFKEVFRDLYDICLDIKLPNDLMINGKKVGGILTETKLQGENVKVLVIGVGINTDEVSFPEEFEEKATSIKKEFNIEVANFRLIFEFLNRFESNFRSVFERRKFMKIGFLFPGQGAQSIGMGKDLYDKYEEYQKVYEDVESLTGVKVADLTFDSTEEVLGQTKNTQICILTMSLAILKLLELKGIKAEASIGLSLGEYSALVASQAISFEDGVKTVKTRGELMQNLCPKGDWSMAAILNLDEETVRKVCNETEGFVVPANFNCPGQIVISGEKVAVDKAMESMKAAGAKRALELKTSGPFHTEKLENASNELRKELEKITINNFKHKVIKNLDGKEYKESDDVKDILAKHITNPVRFEQGIQTMLDMGIDTFIEIGPGKTLTGFVKKANKDVRTYNINSVETLEELLNELK